MATDIEYTLTPVQASEYSVFRCEPVDVVMLWEGGEREILRNVSLVWRSHDGTRQTYRTEAGNVRTGRSAQRHNGHNYRAGRVDALIRRSDGSYQTTE